MNQSSIAVIGCGYWGKNLVRVFNELDALAAVCESHPVGQDRARELVPDVEIVSDFDDVLERDEIRAVAISTPAETHHPLALKAMAAGKDVYVEKPMALDSCQGGEMIKAAKENNDRILMVGHILEYHPAVLRLRELIAAGTLGNVNYIYSNRLNFGKIRTEENALWSFAPHDIAVILRLAGALPIEVTSVGGSYITPNLADVTVSGLHFRTGVRAHIFVSWLNPFKEQKLVVVGDQQMVVFDDREPWEKKLLLYDQRVELDHRQPILQKGAADAVPLDQGEPLKNECTHFLDCIQTRENPRTDGASGNRVLQVLHACQVSLQLNGRPVSLLDL